VRDWRAAAIPDRLRAILEYTERLTLEPSRMEEADVVRLRDAGLDDEAILSACEVVSYFAFVNRMADGLGVRLEPGWRHPIIPMPSEDPGSDPA
jgi:uncharacterized peroxidase-related enzyme